MSKPDFCLRLEIFINMKTNQKLKEAYLDEHVFYGLKNLNDGYDVPSIKYFSEQDFEVVLNRIQDLGLGVYGIEPWQDGSYFDVLTWEEFRDRGIKDCCDPRWYRGAFQTFKSTEEQLQYAATYQIPSSISI